MSGSQYNAGACVASRAFFFNARVEPGSTRAFPCVCVYTVIQLVTLE